MSETTPFRIGSVVGCRSLRAGHVLLALVAIIFVVALPRSSTATELREWKDRSGTFSVRATLVRIVGEHITIQREDGREVTFPTAKLSDADQDYVADVRAGKIADVEFDDSTGLVKLRPSKASASSIQGAPNRGYIFSEAEVSVAPLLALPKSAPWTYRPQGGADKPATASRQTRLPIDPKHAPSDMSIWPLDAGRIAIGFQALSPFGEETGSLMICNVGNGRIDFHAEVLDELPMAVAKSGRWLICGVSPEFARGTAELRLYQLSGGAAKRLVAWRPYESSDSSNYDKTCQWAKFVGEDRLLTLSPGGRLALWSLPEIVPQWSLSLERGGHAAIGNDGRHIAFVVDGQITILDVATGRAAGQLDCDLPSAQLAFEPGGRRLAGIAGDRVCIWNLEAKKLEREFNLLSRLPNDASLDWIDSQHLLAEGLVIDLERRVPIWRHTHILAGAIGSGRLWFVAHPSGGEAILASTKAVPPAALAAVANLKPTDLLVIAPGMEVSIEIHAAGDVQSARDAIERKLVDNGLKVASNARLRLIGSVTSGETRTIRVRPFGAPGRDQNGGAEHTVTEQLVSLSLQYDGRELWRREYPSGPPPIINLNEGETTQQALDRLTFRDASFLAHYSLPKYLARLPENLTK